MKPLTASTRRSGGALAAWALLLCADPAVAVDWDAGQLARYGGTYSAHCSDPRVARLNVTRLALTIDVAKQRMSGTDILAAVSAYGNSRPPPGFQIQLMSQVRGRESLIFEVFLDERGRYVKVSGSPLVEAALGKPTLEARHRDCDPVRAQRDGAAWLAERRAATGGSAVPAPAPQLPVPAPTTAAKARPGAHLVGLPIADEAKTLAAFQRAVGCEAPLAVSPFHAGAVGGRPFRFVGLDCAYVGGNATWAVQMLGFHDGQRYTQVVEFAALSVDTPVRVEGGKIVYEAKVQKDTDARCCPTGRARVEVDPVTLAVVAKPLGFQQKLPAGRGKPLP